MSTTTAETALRPLIVEFSEERIDDLRRRIAATRWPSKELLPDRSHGVQLAHPSRPAALAKLVARRRSLTGCAARGRAGGRPLLVGRVRLRPRREAAER